MNSEIYEQHSEVLMKDLKKKMTIIVKGKTKFENEEERKLFYKKGNELKCMLEELLTSSGKKFFSKIIVKDQENRVFLESQINVGFMKEEIMIKGKPHPSDEFIFFERISGWHRNDGVFIISNGAAKKGWKYSRVSVLDIAPTVLYLLGLPVGRDMDGHVLKKCLREYFQKDLPPQYISSYNIILGKRKSKNSQGLLEEITIKLHDQLKVLGYMK
jgi:hypothetical protein